MGTALSFIPFFDECHRQGVPNGSILAFGDIEFLKSCAALQRFAVAQGLWGLGADNSVKTFFSERFGAEPCLDCDLHDRAALQFDLASRLYNELQSRFRLLLNAGTLGHIFDQPAAYENVHLMLRSGGVKLRLASLTWCEHAYYDHNPRLFRDIARANNYSLLVEPFHGPHGGEYAGCAITFKDGSSQDAPDQYAPLTDKPTLPANLLYMTACRKPRASEDFRGPYEVAEVASEAGS